MNIERLLRGWIAQAQRVLGDLRNENANEDQIQVMAMGCTATIRWLDRTGHFEPDEREFEHMTMLNAFLAGMAFERRNQFEDTNDFLVKIAEIRDSILESRRR